METAHLASHPPEMVSRLLWRPMQKVAQLALQVRDVALEIVRQVQETARLVLRALDAVTLQATRAQTRTQTELIFGPITVSLASGVIFSRAGSTVPE